jgi:hypothetical protein
VMSRALRFAALGVSRLMVCAFCGKETDRAAQGPNVAVCDACIILAEEALFKERRESKGRQVICSFCGKAERQSFFAFRRKRIAYSNRSGDARICSQCLKIAREIVVNLK